MCGGGQSEAQRTAGQLGQERTRTEREFRTGFFPGLKDIFGGDTGLSFEAEQARFGRAQAPRRAGLARRLAGAGFGPDSPVALQTFADFEAGTARGFDEAMQQSAIRQLMARLQAAQVAAGSLRDPLSALALSEEL